jgi:hypothetical protein
MIYVEFTIMVNNQKAFVCMKAWYASIDGFNIQGGKLCACQGVSYLEIGLSYMNMEISVYAERLCAFE